MTSSKTAQLLMTAHSFEERGIPFLCLKPSVDTRDGENTIKSRIGLSRECISVDSDVNLYAFIEEYIANATLHCLEKPKWILVDEAQFLTKKQVNELSDVVDNFDINVKCYGLRTDFTTTMFEGSKRLMEIADTIDEIKASCSCGRKATINARLDSDGKIVSSGKQIVIGMDDIYVTMCRKCFKKALRGSENK
mgnify:CR=1 FL=1